FALILGVQVYAAEEQAPAAKAPPAEQAETEDVKIDPMNQQKILALGELLYRTRYCMFDSATAALQLGVRDKDTLIAHAAKTCAGPLYGGLIHFGFSKEDAKGLVAAAVGLGVDEALRSMEPLP